MSLLANFLIAVLCGCDIALVVFDEHGKLYSYASDQVAPILNRFVRYKGRRETRNNLMLLRTHVSDQLCAEEVTQGSPRMDRLDRTPQSHLALRLDADAFGEMISPGTAVRHCHCGWPRCVCAAAA